MESFGELDKFIQSHITTLKANTFNACAIEWRRTIIKNFQAGGRPKWEPRKRISKRQKGTKILVISGAMKNVNTIAEQSSNTIVLKVDPRAKAYARIHNEGGEISMPGRQIKFRKNKSGRTVFASSKHSRISKQVSGKAYRIQIPKREYTNVPPQDWSRWVSTIKQLNNL